MQRRLRCNRPANIGAFWPGAVVRRRSSAPTLVICPTELLDIDISVLRLGEMLRCVLREAPPGTPVFHCKIGLYRNKQHLRTIVRPNEFVLVGCESSVVLHAVFRSVPVVVAPTPSPASRFRETFHLLVKYAVSYSVVRLSRVAQHVCTSGVVQHSGRSCLHRDCSLDEPRSPPSPAALRSYDRADDDGDSMAPCTPFARVVATCISLPRSALAC